MRSKFISLFIIFILTSVALDAKFEVESISERNIILKLKNDSFHLENIDEKNNLYRIDAEGSQRESSPGHPIVPYFSDVVIIPENGEVTLSVTSFEKKTYENITLEAYNDYKIENDNITYFKSKINNRNQGNWFPENIVTKGKKFYQGPNQFQGIKVYPFKYNPQKKQLVVYRNLIIKLEISGKINSQSNRSNIPISNLASMALNSGYAKSYAKELKPFAENIQTRESVYPSFQFVVDKEGIYKVSYEELFDSLTVFQDSLNFGVGFDLNVIDPRYFHLESENGDEPIYFSGERDGRFDSGDYFEFFGDRHYGDEGYYDDYTSENIYTLTYRDELGSRMAVENGGLVISDPDQYTIPEAFEQTVHFEEQGSYNRLGYLRTEEREDLYFWQYIDAPSMRSIPVELEYPYGSNQHDFYVKACLMGISHKDDLPSDQPDHHAFVRFNSTLIDEHFWFRRSEQIFENQFGIPNSKLEDGENLLYISIPGDVPGIDNIALDYFDVKYWREYRTDADYLKFTKPSDKGAGLFQFELTNFSSDSISVYKVGTSKLENMQVESFTQNGTAPFTITFQDRVFDQNTEYVCVTESNKLSPKHIRPNYSSDLKSTSNYANALIITDRKFIESEGTLLFKELWQENCKMPDGLPVVTKIVDVQDIYDEFNYGIRSADAIKEFIKYAYYNWGGSNSATGSQANYILLLGDGIADERDNSVNRKYNIIPTKMIFQYKHGASASDNWYACVIGDDHVADVNISRINIWEEEQILPIAEKSRYYFENPNYDDLWHHKLTLAAGGKASDNNDIFAQQSERLRKIIPARYDVNRVYTATSTVSPDYLGGTFTLKDNIDEGMLLVQFMGHGGGQIWADYNLFNFSDIRTLTNENYPFVVSMCCYASAFDTPGARSIGESLINEPEKGAIAHVGYSALGYLYEDEDFSYQIFDAMFDKRISKTSEILTYAKAKFYATSGGVAQHALTTGACLTGDPLVTLYYPDQTATITVDNYTPEQGDTVTIQTDFPSDALAAEFIIQDNNEIEVNIPYTIPIINGTATLKYPVNESTESVYKLKIKSYAYSPFGEYSASTDIAVGQSAVFDVRTDPEYPTENDSVLITAGCFDKDGILEFNLVLNTITVNDTNVITMELTEDNYYKSSLKIPPRGSGANIYYHFEVKDIFGETYATENYFYAVEGPDLALLEYKIVTENQKPEIQILIENVGNNVSPATKVKLSENTSGNYIDDVDRKKRMFKNYYYDIPEILSNQKIWVTFDFPVYVGNKEYELMVNPDAEFSESNTANNGITFEHEMNMIYVDANDSKLVSLDGYCQVDFANLINSDSLLVSLEKKDYQEPINQESITRVRMQDENFIDMYKIGVHESGLIDTLGNIYGNKLVELKINYARFDSLNQMNDITADPVVYKWNLEYEKWLKKGGIVNYEDSVVIAYLNQIGDFSLLFNNDTQAPSIDVNVEDQEFTKESYVARDGIISFILADANGIDVVDKDVNLFLSGALIPKENYIITAEKGHLNQVPIKYQIDLEDGVYDITAECTDVNGNYAGRTIEIKVNSNFDVLNLANYPNPIRSVTIDQKNENRTRFTYVLTDDADDVSMKIYTVAGRLVKEFKNLPASIGYHEYPRTLLGWDCRDDNNYFLANGVYFYRLTAKKGGKTIEKTQKMAILK
jgi:hypothetical protein